MSYQGIRIVFGCDHPAGCPAKIEIYESADSLDSQALNGPMSFFASWGPRVLSEFAAAGWESEGLVSRHFCEIHRPGADRDAPVAPTRSPAGVSR